jgi:hypothetical protein
MSSKWRSDLLSFASEEFLRFDVALQAILEVT